MKVEKVTVIYTEQAGTGNYSSVKHGMVLEARIGEDDEYLDVYEELLGEATNRVRGKIAEALRENRYVRVLHCELEDKQFLIICGIGFNPILHLQDKYPGMTYQWVMADFKTDEPGPIHYSKAINQVYVWLTGINAKVYVVDWSYLTFLTKNMPDLPINNQ